MMHRNEYRRHSSASFEANKDDEYNEYDESESKSETLSVSPNVTCRGKSYVEYSQDNSRLSSGQFAPSRQIIFIAHDFV